MKYDENFSAFLIMHSAHSGHHRSGRGAGGAGHTTPRRAVRTQHSPTPTGKAPSHNTHRRPRPPASRQRYRAGGEWRKKQPHGEKSPGAQDVGEAGVSEPELAQLRRAVERLMDGQQEALEAIRAVLEGSEELTEETLVDLLDILQGATDDARSMVRDR